MDIIEWSIKDIANILKERQENEFDGNVATTGNRGDGKSTVLTKIFYRLPKFDPWKHQVYNRDDIIKLLRTQVKGNCFDDEGINSGYKRDFQLKQQKEFIKILTAYRDNFNIYGCAVPSFFSLDKDLRDLFFLHIFVVERGMACIHMPLQGRLYNQDRWDSKYNAKVEDSWSKKILKDPDFRPPYHRLTTFRGYLYFGDLPINQKRVYLEVKKIKRKSSFEYGETEEEKEDNFINSVYRLLIERKLTRDGLIQACLVNSHKYSTVSNRLNTMLTNDGIKETLKDFLVPTATSRFNSKITEQINQIVPDI